MLHWNQVKSIKEKSSGRKVTLWTSGLRTTAHGTQTCQGKKAGSAVLFKSRESHVRLKEYPNITPQGLQQDSGCRHTVDCFTGQPPIPSSTWSNICWKFLHPRSQLQTATDFSPFKVIEFKRKLNYNLHMSKKSRRKASRMTKKASNQTSWCKDTKDVFFISSETPVSSGRSQPTSQAR